MPRISKAVREAREAAAAAAASKAPGSDSTSMDEANGLLTAAQASAALEVGGWTPSVAVSDVSTSGDEGDAATDRYENGTTLYPTADRSIIGGDTTYAASDSDETDDSADDDGSAAPMGRASAASGSTANGRHKREAICRWEECGDQFLDLGTFVDHLHNGE